MRVSFVLKNSYCWLTKEIFLVLISYQDNRCYRTPNPTHVCFWEGDFDCIFDVMRIRMGSRQAEFLGRVKLNDHDHEKNKWKSVRIDPNRTDLTLFLAGGPSYASGYQVNNSLTFEVSWELKKFE